MIIAIKVPGPNFLAKIHGGLQILALKLKKIRVNAIIPWSLKSEDLQ